MEILSNDADIKNFIEEQNVGVRFKIVWDGITHLSFDEGIYIIAMSDNVPYDKIFYPGWDVETNDGWEQNTKGMYKIHEIPEPAISRTRRTPYQILPKRDRGEKSRSRSRKEGGKRAESARKVCGEKKRQ